MDAEELWSLTEPAWQEAFVEAWTSWCSGCWGIGAVVVGDADRIVARGRNRILDPTSVPGVLAGTPLAHAELNALAQIPPGPCTDLRLLTTLEPCLLCASAIRFLRIPVVRYAGADPMFAGVHEHLAGHPFGAGRHPDQCGPIDGPLGAFGSLLPLTFLAFWSADSEAYRIHQDTTPQLASLALELNKSGALASVSKDGGSVLDALALVWDELL